MSAANGAMAGMPNGMVMGGAGAGAGAGVGPGVAVGGAGVAVGGAAVGPNGVPLGAAVPPALECYTLDFTNTFRRCCLPEIGTLEGSVDTYNNNALIGIKCVLGPTAPVVSAGRTFADPQTALTTCLLNNPNAKATSITCVPLGSVQPYSPVSAAMVAGIMGGVAGNNMMAAGVNGAAGELQSGAALARTTPGAAGTFLVLATIALAAMSWS